MKKILVAAVLLGFVSLARAEGVPPLPFTEGTVWHLSFVKVKPGFEVDYLRSLTTTWKKSFDEAKKQKLIISYKIISAPAGSHEDWDLLLMVEYKNMAALDGLQEKMRAITLPMIGGEDGARQLQTKRLEIRDILGEKIGRELILK